MTTKLALLWQALTLTAKWFFDNVTNVRSHDNSNLSYSISLYGHETCRQEADINEEVQQANT